MAKSKKKSESSGFPGQAFDKNFKWEKTDFNECQPEPEDSNDSFHADEDESLQSSEQYTSCNFNQFGSFEKRGTCGYKSTGFREKNKDISAPLPMCDLNPRFNLGGFQPKSKEDKWFKCFATKVEKFFKGKSKTINQKTTCHTPSPECEAMEKGIGLLTTNLVKECSSNGSTPQRLNTTSTNVPAHDSFGGRPFGFWVQDGEFDEPSDCESKTLAHVDKIPSTSEKTPKKRPAATDPGPSESPTKVSRTTPFQRRFSATNGTIKPLTRIEEDSGTIPAMDTSGGGSANK